MTFDFDSVKDEYIEGFDSVSINGNYFIIGGQVDGAYSNTIARLDTATWSWSRAGQLKTARVSHVAIWVNSKLVVVGGVDSKYSLRTEYCDLVNDEFICTEQESALVDYSYPLLFAVTDDYGNC